MQTSFLFVLQIESSKAHSLVKIKTNKVGGCKFKSGSLCYIVSKCSLNEKKTDCFECKHNDVKYQNQSLRIHELKFRNYNLLGVK